jgi:MOSC domain-containing protein YiiM
MPTPAIGTARCLFWPVSLLTLSRKHCRPLNNGAFAENIITRGLDLTQLKIGDRMKIATRKKNTFKIKIIKTS